MTMDASDRRAPGATRIPFEAIVEVSPSLGPAFEAQAVDVSDEGMHLRTAYLPEVGQPLMCRFDAGAAGEVSAQCEVLWRQEGERGGEFGLRFVDLDAQSADALGRIVGVREKSIQPAGAKVRLHIEGLGFPMKARVKDASRRELTVGNELGFLQVGKELELEDAETGEKRPARIDRVEVEIDPESLVPRLVVGLRYEDEPESVPVEPAMAEPVKDTTPEPSVMDPEEEMPAEEVHVAPEPEEAPVDLKGAFAKNAAKVTPAILSLAKRARATAGVLWEKRKQRARERAEATKRTTAPPPGGGLHATGRKVVRASDLVKSPPPKLDTKRKIAIGAVAGLAVALAYAGFHKSPKTEAAHEKPAASVATALAAQPPAPPPPPVEPTPAPQTTAVATDDTPEPRHHARHAHVAPFGNGRVGHGNVLRLKMDGPIAKIDGASEPTGFSVSIPGRRALEPAGPLAARDARIASIKVSNQGSGSELDVAFKDGVPSYLVRAKGDMLEIVLAAPGRIGHTHERAKTTKVAPRRRTHKK
jgi:hypothetical protein